MAGCMNRVTLLGNIGVEPEIRVLNDGGKVCTLAVATNESWKDKNTGEKREKVEWHRVVIWPEALVKICESYVKKGDKIYLEGKMETRKWQAQDGADRYSTEVVLNGFDAKIVLLSSKDGGGNRPPGAQSPDDYGQHTGASKAASNGSSSGQDYGMHGEAGQFDKDLDDEIPF